METSNKLTGETYSQSTLFAVDTLANLLAPQANDEEPTTLDTCGHGFETPLAHYDPDTQSWKTSGDISLWGEQPSLANLPKSGMTRSGVLFPQPDWVRPIDATASLSWPTPRASAAMADSREAILRNVAKKGYKSKLEQAIQLAQVDPSAIGGKLNPTWVEWLMGFPLGWTDLGASETQ
jgi:hypothetical protein